METHSQIPITNILSKEEFTPAELLKTITQEPELTGQYPLKFVKSISREIKQKTLFLIQSTLRELYMKSKFPCLTYSLRQMLLLYHICILSNHNYSPNAIQFLEHIITKVHLYSIITLEQTKTVIQLYDIIIYISNLMSDLIPQLFEKGHFSLVFRSVISISQTITTYMGMVCLWEFIQNIAEHLDEEAKNQFAALLRKTIKNNQCLNFYHKAVSQGSNPLLILDSLILLRNSQGSLEKYNLKIQNRNKLSTVADKSYIWPVLIKQIYCQKNMRISCCPFPISSSNFGTVYKSLLMIEVFCNSPQIDFIQDFIPEQQLNFFVRFIQGESFVAESYNSKLQKWISTLRQMQKAYTGKKQLRMIKQDVLRLADE